MPQPWCSLLLASSGEPLDRKANTWVFAGHVKTHPCNCWQESEREDVSKGQMGLAQAYSNFWLFFLFSLQEALKNTFYLTQKE